MAYYALSMLVIAVELAEENDVYEDMVVKFLEQFLLIARALERQGLCDAEDAFFYDRLVSPSGETPAVKVQTISGLIPLLPAVGLPARTVALGRRLGKRFARLRERWEDERRQHGRPRARARDERTVLLSVIDPESCARTLREFFDEAAFLSPHGLRALSKRYENKPYTLDGVPGATIDYEPAESTTTMFGGNSNWRGPVWFPLNYLAIRQFVLLPALLRRRLHPRVPDRLRDSSTRSARSPRTSPTGSSRSGCPDRTAAARSTAAPSGSRRTPAWRDNLPLLRVLPRRQRRRTRRHAPDRLDGTRRRPDPRPTRVEAGTSD